MKNQTSIIIPRLKNTQFSLKVWEVQKSTLIRPIQYITVKTFPDKIKSSPNQSHTLLHHTQVHTKIEDDMEHLSHGIHIWNVK